MKALHIVLAVLLLTSGTGIASAADYLVLPQDLDGDGLYEDINGNGRADFADVVLFYNSFEHWQQAGPMAACFDFNRNGRLDFADVVTMFNAM